MKCAAQAEYVLVNVRNPSGKMARQDGAARWRGNELRRRRTVAPVRHHGQGRGCRNARHAQSARHHGPIVQPAMTGESRRGHDPDRGYDASQNCGEGDCEVGRGRLRVRLMRNLVFL